MADRRSLALRRRLVPLAALAAVLLMAGVGCSDTRDLGSSGRTENTIRKLDTGPEDDDVLAGGSAGTKQLQAMIDRLLASDDPCAILTQKEVQGIQVDATTLASTAARQVLAQGVIDVYDHLVELIPDPGVRPALVEQRDTFVQVLDLVDRYAANPTSKQGNDQIRALTTGQEFVAAQQSVAGWTLANCS